MAAGKKYIHARLDAEARAGLDELKRQTGRSESELVRRGLQLVAVEERSRATALSLAGRSAGRFTGGPSDLSRNRAQLDGFGE